jgi:hypothetical protein
MRSSAADARAAPARTAPASSGTAGSIQYARLANMNGSRSSHSARVGPPEVSPPQLYASRRRLLRRSTDRPPGYHRR